MATPFTTQRSRRAGVFIGFWILCIVSIVADASTSNGDIPQYVLTIGTFYTSAHRALETLALNATVPQWIPLIVYFVLAIVTVFVSLFILEMYAFDQQYYEFVENFLGLLGLLGAILLAVIASGAILLIFPEITVTLNLFPQTLVFASFLLAISFITSFVP